MPNLYNILIEEEENDCGYHVGFHHERSAHKLTPFCSFKRHTNMYISVHYIIVFMF